MIPIFSLYSGIGGLDLGAHLAGFNLVAALDANGDALTVHQNAFGAKTFCENTDGLDVDRVIRESDIPRDGSAILIGGPPCTAFSHAGFWIETKRKGKDEQSNRIHDYFQFVRALRPRAFVMENVPGLLFKNHKRVLERFERESRVLGYSVSHEILNAADYGVPQRRRRLFVVGVKGEKVFQFQPGTFVDRPRTSGWALRGLAGLNPPEPDEKLRGKYAPLLPKVPPGENYLVFTRKRGCAQPLFGWRKKYWSFLLKLDPKQPAPTIPATRITNNGPFHWDGRHLRLGELKRLQSFPDAFSVSSGHIGRTQVGNAVPPLLAAHVMWQIRLHLGDGEGRAPHRLRYAMEPSATAVDVSDALTLK